MTPADRKAFAPALFIVAETLGAKVSDVALEGYWDALQDLSLAAFQVACKRALRECKFMPRPAELRELAAPAKRPPTPPYFQRWRDPLQLTGVPPRETWPPKEES